MTRKVDLHAHTTASDGLLTPAGLVGRARRNGLSVLAVTDHDTVDAVPAAIAAAAGSSVTVWPGVELSTDVPSGEVHVLGYFVDYTDPSLRQTLASMGQARVARAERMVGRLAELGAPVDFDRVRQLAGEGSIGRPHVAQALVEAGHVATLSEAFDQFLGKAGPAYVEHARFTPVEAVRLIRAYSGVPVLAHPTYALPPGIWSGAPADLDGLLTPLLRQLAIAGLAGLEVFYSRYSRAIVAALREVARRYGLIPTGGSDYHGREPVSAELGNLPVPWETVQRIERLAYQARSQRRAG